MLVSHNDAIEFVEGADDKIAAMEAAGIRVSPSPSELGTTLDAMLKELA